MKCEVKTQAGNVSFPFGFKSFVFSTNFHKFWIILLSAYIISGTLSRPGNPQVRPEWMGHTADTPRLWGLPCHDTSIVYH